MVEIPAGMRIVRAHQRDVRSLLEDAFAATGMAADEAALITDSLIEAELHDVPTHGLLRIPSYLGGLRTGRYNAEARVREVHRGPTAVLFDGDNALGFLPALRCCEAAVEAAQRFGLGAAGARNMNELGRAAYFAEWVAKRGMMGVVASNTLPLLAAPGGTAKTHGNNPFAYALPGEDSPIYDASWTPRAGGEVARRRILGLPLPIAWGYVDSEGKPTTNPADVASAVTPAHGGAKGFGIALLVDLLSAVLTGAAYGPTVPPDNRNIGAFVLAIDPNLFGEGAHLAERLETTASAVRTSGARLPGDRGREASAASGGMVAIPEPIWANAVAAIADGDAALEARAAAIVRG